jgi:hypothetical protein
MHHLFISYSRKDENFMTIDGMSFSRYLYEQFKKNGIDCFYDKESIGVGDDWNTELEKKICQSNYFIMLITKKYFESPICKDEYNLAKARRAENSCTILPILCEDCQEINESFLATINYLEFKKHYNHEHIFQKLYQKITGKENSLFKDRKSKSNLSSMLPRKYYPYLIDREKQCDSFFDKLKIVSLQNNKFCIYIFHGNQDECLPEFFTSIELDHWEKNNNYSSEEQTGLIHKYIKWPDKNENKKIYEYLATKLCDIDKSSPPELIIDQLNQSEQPIMIRTTIVIDPSNSTIAYIDKINHFIQFWESFNANNARSIRISCLLIEYKNPPANNQKINFFFNRRKHSNKELIKNYLKKHYSHYLVDEVTSIEQQHLVDWANEVAIDRNCGEYNDYREVIDLFEDQNKISMRKLINILVPICSQF